MDLVDKQNGIRAIFQGFEHRLKALFEIASELGTGEQRPHVEQVDMYPLQNLRHPILVNHQCQAFGHGRFTNPRFTDIDGIVLTASAEHLYSAPQFLFSADQRVDTAFNGPL